jgi:uncharacterized repeat protein (TIGR03803 family)
LGGDPTCACGVVFKLTKSGKETVLHTFTGGADGSYPESGVTLDKRNLYGTASAGGTNGKGVVFEIKNASESAHPPWTFIIFYTFLGQPDGDSPYGGVISCTDGNLYGATTRGGTYNFGLWYQLNKAGKLIGIKDLDYSFTGGEPLDTFTVSHDGAGNVTQLATEEQGGNINGVNAYGTVGQETYVGNHSQCAGH